MTSCAMVAGMIPMALGLSEGGEQTAPLGRAVIGGLIGATCATLIVLPAIFATLQSRHARISTSLDPDDPSSPYFELGPRLATVSGAGDGRAEAMQTPLNECSTAVLNVIPGLASVNRRSSGLIFFSRSSWSALRCWIPSFWTCHGAVCGEKVFSREIILRRTTLEGHGKHREQQMQSS
jgi:hypothetical protein